MLGKLLESFVENKNEEKHANGKMVIKLAKDYQIFAPNKEWEELKKEIGQAFVDFDIAREHRNGASHVNPVPYEEYIESKKHLLTTCFLLSIDDYYKKLILRK